jgi:type II secretory pathway pseudopilin PulG
MSVGQLSPINSSNGYVMLMVVGMIAIMTAIVFGTYAITRVVDKQNQVISSQNGLNQAKAFVLDYMRQHKNLPDVASFDLGTASLSDAWGRKLLYFPSSNLLSGDVCLSTTTNISLQNCANDISCATSTNEPNLPFMIISGGEISNPSSNPIYQTTQHTGSTSVTSAESFKQYREQLIVGPYLTPTDLQNGTGYDDIFVTSSLPEIYSTAGCLSKTQGDVQISGGMIRLLNKNDVALSTAYCPGGFSKEFVAYGKTGAYSWSTTPLPTGLSATPSTTNKYLISGVPDVSDGTYTFTVTVADSAGKSDSKTYQLPISGCCIPSVIATRSLSCASAAYTGSISQEQRTQCDGTTQWVTVSDTCVSASVATFDGRFAELISSGGFPADSFDSGQTSLDLGSGTSAITISASSNLSRHRTTSDNPAIGIMGGTYGIDPGETLNIDFTGGYGRRLGIEFRGLQDDKNGSSREEAWIVFKDTNAGTTIATYYVKACQSGDTARSYFSLPDVGAPFNRIEVTPNDSPSNTDFYIRGVRSCDVGATSCQPAGSSNYCPYP